VRKGRDNLLFWDLDLKTNIVKLREPTSGKVKLEFPARPMLGCIGVAAPGDFSPTSGPSGSYGGNLDYNEIAEGATVILPVYHKGALLFMGAGHAIMADGEPTGTGVETSMDSRIFCGNQKERPHQWPAGRDRRLRHQPGIATGVFKLPRPRPANGNHRHDPLANHRLPA
jgi:acetamidase/formamidase